MISSRVVQTSCGGIEVAVDGDGPPCLLLHGGHGSCRDSFGRSEIARSGRSVVAVSRPGYGQTPLGTGSTPARAGAAMVELLDALDMPRAAVLGISAGGPTAIETAAALGDRADALVLTSAVTDRWLQPSDLLYRQAQLMFRPRVEAATWAMSRGLAARAPRLLLRSLVAALSALPLSEAMARIDRSPDAACQLAAIVEMVRHQRSGEGFLADIEAQVPAASLRAVTCPTTIIHSRHDGSVPATHPERAAAEIADATLHWVDTWGHLVWLGEGSDTVISTAAAALTP